MGLVTDVERFVLTPPMGDKWVIYGLVSGGMNNISGSVHVQYQRSTRVVRITGPLNTKRHFDFFSFK